MQSGRTEQPSHKTRGCLVRAFTWIAGAYGAVVTLFLLLRQGVSDTFLPMALYATTAYWLWLGALCLLALTLVLRAWRALPLLLLPAAAWVFVFGLRFFNSAEETGRSGVTITALTYNIQWRSEPYQETLALIREIDADIVALQEISPDAAAQIESGLSDAYPYMALDPLEWGYSGQALLSKFPIVEHEFFEFEVNATSFGQQRLVIDHPSYPLVVYNVHLLHPLVGGLNFALRANEVDALSRRIREERAATHMIVMGDFNMTDLNDDYGVISGLMRDAYRDVGTGMGLTHTLRLRGIDITRWMRLDYIFTRGGVDALDARVMTSAGGSDHAPVWARLEIFDPSASYPQP